MMTFTEQAEDLLTKTNLDFLGADERERKVQFRILVKKMHPDRKVGEDRALAEQAFTHLTELMAKQDRADAGRFEITTKQRTYRVDGLAHQGRVSNLYRCSYERDGATKEGLLHLPRSLQDNDLVMAAAKNLKAIWELNDERREFFPRYEETFRHRDKSTKLDRRALVLRTLPGFYSLEQVRDAYPEGLDGRDLAWMWRRLLAAISLPHEHGIIHGALVPEHILIHPQEHGVLVVGWSSSVEEGAKLKVLGGRSSLYPPEVFSHAPTTKSTDLYTLTRTMSLMLRHDAPRQFLAFVQGCTFKRPQVRPQDARQLLGEFDQLIERLYGPRRFREFQMPNQGT